MKIHRALVFLSGFALAACLSAVARPDPGRAAIGPRLPCLGLCGHAGCGCGDKDPCSKSGCGVVPDPAGPSAPGAAG